MMQEEQFARLLQLRPSKERYVTKKGRPLTINIDLKPVEPNNGQPWTPKTPCSMLSPLAPKTPCSMLSPLTPKQGRKLEWQRSVDRTPKSAKREIDLYKEQLHPLMVFDVCSPLGKRISNNLEELVKNHQIPIIRDYERLCNPQSPPEEEETRKLRAVSGRVHPAYRKRQCHRHVERNYFFKASDKAERRRVLFSGGLNKASRHLWRQIGTCVVVINPLPTDGQTDNEMSESESNGSVADIIEVQMDHDYMPLGTDEDNDIIVCNEEFCTKENQSQPTKLTIEDAIECPVKKTSRQPPKQLRNDRNPIKNLGSPTSLKYLTPIIKVHKIISMQSNHRKSKRRRKEPRRLINIM